MSASWLVLALLQAVLAVGVAFRLLRSAGGTSIAASDAPRSERVSVVIPVLDEERRIEACLRAVCGQPEEVAEILVVDGGSRDRTREIVAAQARRDPRVVWVDASPIPAGWTGKAWGMRAGLDAVQRADFLLFLDADVTPSPSLVRSLLAHAERTGVQVFSVATRQRLAGSGDALVHPACLASLVVRFGIPGRASREPAAVQANGQCLLARRSLLLETSAIEAASDSLCEDVTVARALASAGVPVGFYEGGGLVEASMYGSARETFDGWTRSLPMRDRFSDARLGLGILEVVLVQALPLPLLGVALAVGAPGPVVLLQGALVALRLGILAGTSRAYVERPPTFWLSPLLDLPVAGRIVQRALQRHLVWRGRRYQRLRGGGFRLEGEAR